MRFRRIAWELAIEYETTASDGLYWIEALQTTGDHAPLLFPFGQPDKTREWIPIGGSATPARRSRIDRAPSHHRE